ncbi:MAG: methyltransferase [Candidatus Verstraetearchaeota archaeon]|nr:methyltransferase [Candidatus Verstraetearchaeota archaeon]
MIRSKSELEILLERIEGFRSPKLQLEQYRLPAPVAAEILWYIGLRHKDLENLIVADLGCGTGMLTAGAALMGADYTIGVDLDADALSDAKRWIRRLHLKGRVDFLRGAVEELCLRADVVIQNPPFGVRKREADRIFLRAGLRTAQTVYSLHKGGDDVRRFMRGFVKECGGKIDEVLPLKIKLPPTYQFHKRKFHVFDVDLYRVVRGTE